MLLTYLVGEGMRLEDIKQSSCKRLLDKPIIKKILQQHGCRSLGPQELGSLWPASYQCYLLSIGAWGARQRWQQSYKQTSRPGWNLVLQLNFSEQHTCSYTRLVKPDEGHPFHCESHPIARNGKHTLAWARLDIDLEKDEALIEEIQTDWLRMARRSRQFIERVKDFDSIEKDHLPYYIRGIGGTSEDLKNYYDRELKPHTEIWEEAMLAAVIWFLKEELGITTIYYHTFDFGCKLKGITGRRPPRSLYTRLPDRFCFEKTERGPSFMQEKMGRKLRQLYKQDTPQFYTLGV